MKVFVVGESSWGEYHEQGTFSTREKAEAYIAMVAAAEVQLTDPEDERSRLSIEEIEVDSGESVFPVFTATGYLGAADEPHVRVSYFTEVPESRFFVTLNLNGGLEEVYAAEGFGRTVSEAREQLASALARAAEKEPADA